MLRVWQIEGGYRPYQDEDMRCLHAGELLFARMPTVALGSGAQDLLQKEEDGEWIYGVNLRRVDLRRAKCGTFCIRAKTLLQPSAYYYRTYITYYYTTFYLLLLLPTYYYYYYTFYLLLLLLLYYTFYLLLLLLLLLLYYYYLLTFYYYYCYYYYY